MSLEGLFSLYLTYHPVQSFGVMITLCWFCGIINHIKLKQHRVKSSSVSCEKSAFSLQNEQVSERKAHLLINYMTLNTLVLQYLGTCYKSKRTDTVI